jgi:predicted nucleic acid-binding protein
MVVIDANLLVALVSGDPRGNLVLQQFLEWIDRGTDINAPALARYEFANALTRLIAGGAFPAESVEDAWNNVSILPIIYHDMKNVGRAVEIALTLGRQNAYDAAYLALSESIASELWTLDGPLYRNASGHGYAVRLIS